MHCKIFHNDAIIPYNNTNQMMYKNTPLRIGWTIPLKINKMALSG
jgi:hypothetical protein